MEQLAQTVILGLLIGGVYALMASGLTLVFGVMRIVNVAHGAMLIAAAMITWYVWSATGIDPFLIAIPMTLVMFGAGWLLYRTVISRIQGASVSMSVLLTFGIALTIEGLLNVFAGNKFRSATPSYFDESFRIGGLVFPKTQVYGAAVAMLTLGVLFLVLTRTWTGRAIRATSQNPTGAALIGISSGGVAALAFAIGTSTAGVGGSILSVLYPFFPASHYDWIARLLGIIVLGGMGSLAGAFVGALSLGLAETLTATYLSLQWATLVVYLVILVVLLVRPQGLFGTQLREDAVAA
jgi:branched-chain amino acid transport system permease protein